MFNALKRIFTRRPGDRPTEPVTKGYTAQFPRRWFMVPRELPVFNFQTIYAMLVDPHVQLCLQMRRAPLYSMQLAYPDGVDETGKPKYKPGVECSNPAVAQWLERQISTIWASYLPAIASSQIWGWSGGEITLKLSAHGLIEIDKLLPRHAADVLLVKKNQCRAGIRVRRVVNAGDVDLDFPYCWFHSFNPESGEEYGNPILLGAYSPWADKWLQGAALDTRRLYMHKDAYGGMQVGYPEEMVQVRGQNEPVSARDVALQIAEQRAAGGVITYPTTRDMNGHPKWEIKEATVASNPQHILQYPKDLDDEIRHGMHIPDDVISNDGSGAWAGKRVPMAAFYAGMDDWIGQIFCDFRYTLEPLIMLNWGKAIDFCLKHKPLALTAMEQQSAGGGFQQQQQQQPGAEGGFGLPMRMSTVKPEEDTNSQWPKDASQEQSDLSCLST